ncbi:MAG: ATP-binding cassette domain-containing protein [Verrucomicrobia bacterium]|nr:ATP-binding cassette domain-containing protein [Kiritimatiellia bacterium]MCO6399759.1 ATP-binding cassette domain-containing protein [Verrucomicrobiota bacterium]
MIRFENVTKRLGRRNVLDGFDLEIKAGETFVICGPSGMGKSVTLKHMVRLLTPDSGHVWVGDDCVSEARGKELERIRARFGVLFQSGALLEWLTAGENVGLPLREHTDKGDEEIDTLAREKLRMVELEDAFDKHPSDLSGGMRKRVALARAIITEPEIVLYDEPTSGLDPVTSRTIDELIDNLRKQLGITSVVVTHDLHSALAIGNRIAMLNYGKAVEVSAPEEFMKSTNSVVRGFLEAQYITRRGAWEKGLKV